MPVEENQNKLLKGDVILIIDGHAHIFKKVAGMTKARPTTSLTWGKVKVGDEVCQWFPPCFSESNAPAEMLMTFMDWVGIDKALIVNHQQYGYNNEYVSEIIHKYPHRFAALATLDFFKGEESVKYLEEISKSKIFKGIKFEVPHSFQCYPDMKINDPSIMPIWRQCNNLNIPVMMHMRPGDLPALKEIYQQFRDIIIIISHLGNPPYKGWTELIDFAKNANRIYFDISALPWQFAAWEEYPYPNAQEHIKIARDEVGAERLIWGSDFPMILSVCTYQQTINLIRKGCGFLSKNEKDKILGDNIFRLLNL